MRKKGIWGLGILLAVLFVAVLVYISIDHSVNSNQNHPAGGVYITTEDLPSLCNLNQSNFCGVPFSCEGKTFEGIGGYAYALGISEGELQLVYSYSQIPTTFKDFSDLRQNHLAVSVKVDNKTALEKEFNSMNFSNEDIVFVTVRNAKIVGQDMPTKGNCLRGISLEANAKDISFLPSDQAP